MGVLGLGGMGDVSFARKLFVVQLPENLASNKAVGGVSQLSVVWLQGVLVSEVSPLCFGLDDGTATVLVNFSQLPIRTNLAEGMYVMVLADVPSLSEDAQEALELEAYKAIDMGSFADAEASWMAEVCHAQLRAA